MSHESGAMNQESRIMSHESGAMTNDPATNYEILPTNYEILDTNYELYMLRQKKGIIFLVGFMGCGKSTKAKQLAQRLGCPVIDLDDELVRRAGQSITEYFAAHGEAGFRELERDTLRQFDYPQTCVVATGGGLPCFHDNMKWINDHGHSVYLKMEPAQLVSRLQKREKRPLIKDMDDATLLNFIAQKLEERNPFYNQSKIILNAFDLSAEQLEQAVFS
ncbi:shikimate kinase [Pedobacter sp. SYP-B3415]|uniref:shikimate kinase n=1 Tax=Pedobacter sp. SYP-B3415 TaxID=2496641 RepID=UPI001F0E6200|nr:shikimate kinase [Pedobacter sp. SYP-B3415]